MKNILYHYCSNSSFINIILSGVVWLSDLSLSNDTEEGRWGIGMTEKYISQHRRGSDSFRSFLSFISTRERNQFGFCLSEEGDLLSQWRAYGEDGAGLSVGFDYESINRGGSLRIANTTAKLRPVVYEISDQTGYIERLAKEWMRIDTYLEDKRIRLSSDSASRNYSRQPYIAKPSHVYGYDRENSIFWEIDLMIDGLFLLKNPAFSEEREWRIVASKALRPDCVDFGEDLSSVKYRTNKSKIVPFIEFGINPKIVKKGLFSKNLNVPYIKEIVIGSKNPTPEYIIHRLLERGGHEGVVVRRSVSTYR